MVGPPRAEGLGRDGRRGAGVQNLKPPTLSVDPTEADADALRLLVEGMEFRRMFNNPMDPNNCFIPL
eukprot:gene15782-19988_t